MSIQIISPTELIKPARITCCLYGESRSGKTEFAATWPNPIFISDGTEGGYITIRRMDKSKFFDQPPKVIEVFTTQDIYAAVTLIEDTAKKTPGKYATVVIDSLSFIQDLVLDELASTRDKWEMYGKLKDIVRRLMIRIHQIGQEAKKPMNVVWIALADSGSETKTAGPLLIGQMRDKVPAACNVLLHQVTRSLKPTEPPVFETRTKAFNGFPAGSRIGDLPDPLPTSTYKSLVATLG